jgi:predicted homoserine dehydrogenase-like protein
MGNKVRVLVVGVGNMGLSHAKAHNAIEGFELARVRPRFTTEMESHTLTLSRCA